MKPLITNSKLLRSEEAVIDKFIYRFNINSEYYNEKLQKKDGNLNGVVDREMGEFFQRRQSVLESLRTKTNLNIIHNPKYHHVSAKLYHPESTRTSYEQLPKMARSKTSTTRLT